MLTFPVGSGRHSRCPFSSDGELAWAYPLATVSFRRMRPIGVAVNQVARRFRYRGWLWAGLAHWQPPLASEPRCLQFRAWQPPKPAALTVRAGRRTVLDPYRAAREVWATVPPERRSHPLRVETAGRLAYPPRGWRFAEFGRFTSGPRRNDRNGAVRVARPHWPGAGLRIGRDGHHDTGGDHANEHPNCPGGPAATVTSGSSGNAGAAAVATMPPALRHATAAAVASADPVPFAEPSASGRVAQLVQKIDARNQAMVRTIFHELLNWTATLPVNSLTNWFEGTLVMIRKSLFNQTAGSTRFRPRTHPPW